jgi:integrase
MFLSKRKNGIYYIVYDQPNGKRTCKSSGTKYKAEALKYLSHFESILKEEKNNVVIPITLEMFRFQFIRYSETIHSWNHTKAIRASFNELIKYYDNIALTELTNSKLQDYIEYRLRKVSSYAVKRDIANFSSAFNWSISKGYLINNPCKGIKKPKIPQKMPLYYTDSEFQMVLDSVKDKDLHNLIEFASLTGLRQSDIISLQWEQVNLKNGSIILDNRSTLTKSRKVHTLPLNKRAHDILTYRKLNQADKELVFTYLGKPIKQDFISKKFKKYVKALNINPKLNFHSIRHYFASRLVKSGVPIYTVSKLLTHSDLRVTQIYAHLSTEDLRDSVNVL